MAKKKAVAPNPPIEEADVIIKALEYNTLNKQAKEKTDEASAIKEQLKEFNADNGIPNPKGSIIYTRTHAGSEVSLINEKRTGKPSLKPDAILRLKKTRFSSQLIEQREEVNLDKLEDLINKGKLPAKLIDELFEEPTESFAFKVSIKSVGGE